MSTQIFAQKTRDFKFLSGRYALSAQVVVVLVYEYSERKEYSTPATALRPCHDVHEHD
jgi:hypothetical protein